MLALEGLERTLSCQESPVEALQGSFTETQETWTAHGHGFIHRTPQTHKSLEIVLMTLCWGQVQNHEITKMLDKSIRAKEAATKLASWAQDTLWPKAEPKEG